MIFANCCGIASADCHGTTAMLRRNIRHPISPICIAVNSTGCTHGFFLIFCSSILLYYGGGDSSVVAIASASLQEIPPNPKTATHWESKFHNLYCSPELPSSSTTLVQRTCGGSRTSTNVFTRGLSSLCCRLSRCRFILVEQTAKYEHTPIVGLFHRTQNNRECMRAHVVQL